MTEISKTASAAGQSVLLPQGDHAGKPGLPLGSRPFTLIGSRNRAHLHLLSTTISRSHACIISSKSGLYVRDLASRTGVHVNGRKVKEMDLQDGDMLEVGSFKFRLQEPLGAIHLATTPRPPLAMLEGAGGKPTPLDERSVLIGRRPTCEILLDSATVSSTHAIIFECDGQRYIRDLGSRTGTHVNGDPVHQQILHSGDQIRIGDTAFRYVSSDAPVEELEEDSDPAGIAVDLIEEDELAPMPVPTGHHEDVPAHATDVDDLAPLHTHHTERPADPIVAARIEREAIPIAADDELATDAQKFDKEQAPAPVESETTAPAANGEFVVADDLVESQWQPIDFAEENEQSITDLAAPVAEQGLTAAADVLPEEEPGLDIWGPATETPVDLVASKGALEASAPVEAEAVPANAEAAEQDEPAESNALAHLDLADLEDVPGEYPSAPIGLEPIAVEPQFGFTHSETSLAPSLEDLEEAGGAFNFSDAAAVAPLPLEIDVTTVELGPELDAATSPVSLERHEEIVLPPLVVTSPAEPHDEDVRSIEPQIPLSVEAVDLSAVTFEVPSPPPETTEALTQPQPEPSSAPQPLLDLTPAPVEEIALEGLAAPAETAIDEWADTAAGENAAATAEPATSEKKDRKPRTPRKKPTTARQTSRRKKGEEIQAADAPELVAHSLVAEQPNISEPVEAERQPADVEATLPTAAADLSSEPTEVLSENAEQETSELVPNAEAPVAEPLFKLGDADLMRVEAAQVAVDASSLVPVSEPLLARASAEEHAGEAFYSGPAEEAHPLVPVESHEPPQSTEPATTEVVAETDEDSEPEILAFEAAATTPEAREVMAAWHDIELDAKAIEAQPATSTENVLPALPAPAAMTADMQAVEPIAAAPSASESSAAVTAWAHEVETIEKTEPTVESALDLEPSLAQVPVTSSAPDLIEVDTTLTDTAFGRAVSDFTGSGLGPLVEEASPSSNRPDGVPDPSMSFDHVPEDVPEFVMPASSNGDQADYLNTEFLDAEFFEAGVDSGHLAAAKLSTDLPGEVATPSQDFTLGKIPDEPATVDATALAADLRLTSGHEIELPPSVEATDDDDFIAIGEDALIEPLEFEEQAADEVPAIDVFGPAEIEVEPEPIVAEQPPAPIATEVLAQTPRSAPVVGKVEAPTPTPAVAETPAPAPAPQPVPLDPYFGMERDTGSF